MQERLHEIAAALGADVQLIEFGSGSGLKTRLLLRALPRCASYVPIDISEAALSESVPALRSEFPELPVQPLCADFAAPVALPRPPGTCRRRVLFFPGSTIGNFELRAAVALMRRMRELVGPGGGRVDRGRSQEGPGHDRGGVQRSCRRHRRVHAEHAGALQPRARRRLRPGRVPPPARAYNPMAGRIETHLVSLREQEVRVEGQRFRFAADEPTLVEFSCKYTVPEFVRLAVRAGWRSARIWTDAGAASASTT
jgi:uncharacterized SAM-dependent methyltransferase